MQKLTITQNEAGQRLDKLLSRYLSAAPKSFLYRMLRKKNIELNGRRGEPSDIVKEGDEINLWLSDETIASFRGKPEETARKEKGLPGGWSRERIRELILYEDENLILADKPKGILSQKGKPSDLSINELLLAYLREKDAGKEGGLAFTPSVCNRLDRNTSGLITFAKTYPAARTLSELFSGRRAGKFYLTLVWGSFLKKQRLRAYLSRGETENRVRISREPFPGADPVETVCEPLSLLAPEATGLPEPVTLLRIQLMTGKTHQIRAHLRLCGYPLLGDPKYGDPALNRILQKKYGISHQMLHSRELIMPERIDGPLSYLSGRAFQAPIPDSFQKLIGTIDKTK